MAIHARRVKMFTKDIRFVQKILWKYHRKQEEEPTTIPHVPFKRLACEILQNYEVCTIFIFFSLFSPQKRKLN